MTDLEKAGFSPQVEKAIRDISSAAVRVYGYSPDPLHLGNMLSTWEAESRITADAHRVAMTSRAGHPALKRKR